MIFMWFFFKLKQQENEFYVCKKEHFTTRDSKSKQLAYHLDLWMEHN